MARKTLYFDSYCGYIVSAITENGKITEFNYEKHESGSIIGNIYKGRVESVLPGIQAAFINCGLERNCYLSSADLPDGEKYESGSSLSPQFPKLKEGEEIMVQITKPPVGKKGAKVTAHPSFVGRSIIYMPETPYIGVSRKIEDEELRRNLVFSAERLKNENEGLVIRTAAPYAKREQIEVEYKYLKNLYAGIKQKFKNAKVGDLLYTDSSLPIRILRDLLDNDIESIVVGTEKLAEQISSHINLYPQRNRRPVTSYNSGRDMMDELGIAAQIKSVGSPRVNLENGAYLIIEKCEALTVIDVNTGSFTGDDSLEQTVYSTNILAAREIARQVRLRNISGIVVVDFIDMINPSHGKALVEELKRALKNDSAKCIVSPMSQFGLVEFTRKRMGHNRLSQMIKPCRYCGASGHTYTAEFIIFDLRAKLLNLIYENNKLIRIDLNNDLCTKLLQWNEMLDDIKAHAKGSKIYAVPHNSYHEEQINIRTDNPEIPAGAFELC